MKITSKKGFSLLEITLVLGVGAAMAFNEVSEHEKRSRKHHGEYRRLADEANGGSG